MFDSREKVRMKPRSIKLTIDSSLDNVSLVGLTVNKLCASVSSACIDPNEIELCVVEAVNNCIEHAYGKKGGHTVEVHFSIYGNRLVIAICDTGKAMDPVLVEQTDASLLDLDHDDLHQIAEEGRGLAIMKGIMNRVTYKTEGGKNCLTLTKNL
jgi:serine/threonine-protein kinase RsbW